MKISLVFYLVKKIPIGRALFAVLFFFNNILCLLFQQRFAIIATKSGLAVYGVRLQVFTASDATRVSTMLIGEHFDSFGRGNTFFRIVDQFEDQRHAHILSECYLIEVSGSGIVVHVVGYLIDTRKRM